MLKSTLIALSIATLSLPAAASSGYVEFSYDPYELNSPSGAEDVFERLSYYVENACEQSGPRSLSARREEATCVEELMADIVSDIDHPRLTAIYQDELGYSSYARY